MTDQPKDNKTAREKLWAKETANSWNISTRVLLIVALKGSFFDERNPRLSLLKKLETVIDDATLRRLEEESLKARNATQLRDMASHYNRRYLELFLERFKASELRALSISASGEVIPSRELENSARH